jgi:rSAM/selenodomain-associated transferase 1
MRGTGAADPSDVSLIVIAKAPLPGFAKTRLIPDLGEAGASRVAEACLADTLWAVAEARAARRVLVIDGEPGEWLPRVEGRRFEVIPQRRGGLGERLAGAFSDSHAAPALLIGMDTPQVTASLLEASAAALCADGVDAVLGPASDGGWWAIGLRTGDPAAFDGVPMSADDTGERQRGRLAALGLSFTELEQLRDIDTLADAEAVAAVNPWTRMAAALRALAPGEAAGSRPVPSDGS